MTDQQAVTPSTSSTNSNSNSNQTLASKSNNNTNLQSRWTLPKALDPTKTFQFGRIINSAGGGGGGGVEKEVREEGIHSSRNDLRIDSDQRRGIIAGSRSTGLLENEEVQDDSMGLRRNELNGQGEANSSDNSGGTQRSQGDPMRENSFLSSLRISSNSLTGGIGSRISNISSTPSNNNRDVFSPSSSTSRPISSIAASSNRLLQNSTNNLSSTTNSPLDIVRPRMSYGSGPNRSVRSQLSSSPPRQNSLQSGQPQDQNQLMNSFRKRDAPSSELQSNLGYRQDSQNSRNNSNQSGDSNNISRIRIRGARESSRERESGSIRRSNSFKRTRYDIEGSIGSIIGSLSDAETQLDSKDEKLEAMAAELKECKTELAKEVAAKEKIRRLSIGKFNSALLEFQNVKNELQLSLTGMKTAFQNISSELGGVISVADVRVEIADMKENFANLNLADLSADKLESSRVELMRELQGEVEKRQSVIELLRKELATRMGEITEARDRISTLEAQSDKRIDKLDQLVLKLESIRETSEAMEEMMLQKGREARESSDRALLLAGELELEKMELIRIKSRVDELQESLLEKTQALGATSLIIEDLKTSQSSYLLELKSLTSANSDLLTSTDLLRSEYDQFRVRSKDEADRSRNLIATLNEGLNSLKQGYEKTLEGVELSTSSTELEIQKINTIRLQESVTYHSSKVEEVKNEIKGLKYEKVDLQKRMDATISESNKKIADGLTREKECTNEIAQVQAELRKVNNILSDYRASQSRIERNSDTGSTEEVQKLRQQLEKVRATNGDFNTQVTELNSRISQLNSEKLNISEYSIKVETQLEERTVKVEALNVELRSLKEELSQSELKYTELESKQAAAVKSASAQIYKNCEEESKRALAVKANELKRLSNKFEDLTKKHQRALAELAKAKNRPVIDPHMTSSSPADMQNFALEQQLPVVANRPGPSRVSFAEVLETPIFNEQITIVEALIVPDEKSLPSVTLSSLGDEQSPSFSSPDEVTDYTMESTVHNSAEKAVSVSTKIPPVVETTTVKGRRTRSTAGAGSINTRAGSILSIEEDIEDDSEETLQLTRPSKARAQAKTTYSKKKK